MDDEQKKDPVFTIDKIQDVKIYVKSGNKHYPLHTNEKVCSLEEGRKIRLEALKVLFETHGVIEVAMEDLKEK